MRAPARSGATCGKVCYRVLAASAVLLCTCSRSALRVATARAAAALARCSIVCQGTNVCRQRERGGKGREREREERESKQ